MKFPRARATMGAGIIFLLTAGTALADFPLRLDVEGDLGRNATGGGVGLEKIANMRLSLLDQAGASVNVEEHCGVATSGRFGSFSLCMGMTVPVDVLFDGLMNVRVEACFDKDGCDGVVDVDTCDPRDFVDVLLPLDPVGFAHRARNADNAKAVDGLDADTLLQELSFAHPMLSISDGNSVSLGSLANSSLAYDSATRNLTVTDGSGSLSASLASLSQTLSRSGTNVTLSNGGGTVSIADDDSSPTNEIQSIARSGLDVTLSNGGGSFSVADDDNNPSNELQTLSLSGNTLSISSGNSVSIPGDNLGSHVATTHLDMGGFDVNGARYGSFGEITRFSNHALSSRLAAGSALDVAFFGSNEGTSGLEVGVYGRTRSPAGFGVYSEGNLKVTGAAFVDGTLKIGAVPVASDTEMLTVDGAGNVRKRTLPDTGNAYQYFQFVDHVDFLTYQTWVLGCPSGKVVAGGGAVDGGNPDLDCWTQSTGPNENDASYMTRILCPGCGFDPDNECNGENYTWQLTCVRP